MKSTEKGIMTNTHNYAELSIAENWYLVGDSIGQEDYDETSLQIINCRGQNTTYIKIHISYVVQSHFK